MRQVEAIINVFTLKAMMELPNNVFISRDEKSDIYHESVYSWISVISSSARVVIFSLLFLIDSSLNIFVFQLWMYFEFLCFF